MFKTLLELEPHELNPLPINGQILLDSMTTAKAFGMNEAKAFYRRLYSTEDPEPPTDPSRIPCHPPPMTGDKAIALPLSEPESTSET